MRGSAPLWSLYNIIRILPNCGAVDTLIRWGFYKRQARTGLAVYRIRVQRVRCTACEHTHSLLPDFLHPYRHYVLSLLQRVISLYLFGGLGIDRLLECLGGAGPGPLHGPRMDRVLRLRSRGTAVRAAQHPRDGYESLGRSARESPA